MTDELIDAGPLGRWLAEAMDIDVSSVEVTRLAGGRASGAWRVDLRADGAHRPMVLKAPTEPSVVYQRDAAREGRVLDALHRLGAPVPAVIAIDADGRSIGRPCFVMEYVEGRSVEDEAAAGHHADGWFRDASPADQAAMWESFYDALAAVHLADPSKVPDASFGPNGVLDVLDHWREALLDAAPESWVPRQLAAIDWLVEHVPAAGDASAVCMGDARLVNSLIAGNRVSALIDFEIAYVGNPAADVGYGLFVDALQRANTEQPIDALPSNDDTWARWSRVTGRSLDDRAYWTGFGGMIFCVTATRAMIQWGFGDPAIEDLNPIVPAWEALLTASA